jgi:predicted restriction endonuclease
MITIFHDKLQTNAHRLFQAWREVNPSGYFINCKGPKNSLLHDASCSHLGDTNWESDEDSLTDKRKICARTISELRDWAAKHQLTFGECRHCKRRGLDDKSPEILSKKEYADVIHAILLRATLVAVEEEFEMSSPGRVKTTVSRVIRDTALARSVKELHGYRCQLCGHAIQLLVQRNT